MTGTKIVKVRLDGNGAGDGLPRLREDPTVKKAVDLFESLPYNISASDDSKYFDGVIDGCEGWNLQSPEIQKTLDTLIEKHSMSAGFIKRAGLFISALIEGSTHRKFDLEVHQPLDYIGYHLRGGKEITLKGDVGKGLGFGMGGIEASSITLDGNAGFGVGGWMCSGKIHVKGDAGNSVGFCLGKFFFPDMGERGIPLPHTPPLIIIDGNAGTETGNGMREGKIQVNGEMGENAGPSMDGGIIEAGKVKGVSAHFKWGRIYENGVLIAGRE
ncbi:MAG: hypothetical protein V1921_06385 [Candidatus Altiarchaeota archaeon]